MPEFPHDCGTVDTYFRQTKGIDIKGIATKERDRKDYMIAVTNVARVHHDSRAQGDKVIQCHIFTSGRQIENPS